MTIHIGTGRLHGRYVHREFAGLMPELTDEEREHVERAAYYLAQWFLEEEGLLQGNDEDIAAHELCDDVAETVAYSLGATVWAHVEDRVDELRRNARIEKKVANLNKRRREADESHG